MASVEDTAMLNAEAIVVDRMQSYGHPRDNFKRGATMWRAYILAKYNIKVPFNAEDYAQMMILVKQARLMEGYHEDSVEDQAGYAKCHHLLAQEPAKDIDWNINQGTTKEIKA